MAKKKKPIEDRMRDTFMEEIKRKGSLKVEIIKPLTESMKKKLQKEMEESRKQGR